MKQVKFYKIASSNVITDHIPPRISQDNIKNFKIMIMSKIVQDLRDIYLVNPYYTRPLLVFSPDLIHASFGKTFYAIESEVENLLNRWANLSQTLAINEMTPVNANKIILKEFYGLALENELLRAIFRKSRKLAFVGRDVTLFSDRGLRELTRKMLSSKGVLFEFNCFIGVKNSRSLRLMLFLFVPVERELEFL
jgi:hypothetical protein